jgi:hypothetical protein
LAQVNHFRFQRKYLINNLTNEATAIKTIALRSNIMTNTEFEPEYSQNPYPNLPPIIESLESEYLSNGVTSSVAIAGHPIHPIIVVFPVAFLMAAAGSDLGLNIQIAYGLGGTTDVAFRYLRRQAA